jgi:ArsR family transcriptional regulator, virulence genes transcriptional regulator
MSEHATRMNKRPKRSSLSRRAFDADTMRENADEAAQLLKVLANGQRLRVLCLLVDEELSVGQINERIDLSQSALSQHLAMLRAEGLVTTRREAQTIYYRLTSGPTKRIISELHDIYCDIESSSGLKRRSR